MKYRLSTHALFGFVVFLPITACTAFAQTYEQTVEDLKPIAYWRLGEGGGVTAQDETGQHDGAYVNGVSLNQQGVVTSDAAVYFVGDDDYVEVEHSPDFLLSDGSISFWFKAESISSRRELWSKDSTGYDGGGHLTIYLKSSKLHVRLQNTSESFSLESGGIATSIWHHVVFTFGQAGMKLYVDGSLKDTHPYSGGLAASDGSVENLEPIAIGASTWASDDEALTPLKYYYSGVIDEIGFFNYALTSQQVQDLADPGWIYENVSQSVAFNVQTTDEYHGGSGLHWGDFDDDGDLDSIITGYDQSRLMISDNAGQHFFSSVFGGGGRGRQGALLDIDTDDDLDFYHRDEILFQNNCSGTFSNIGSLGFTQPDNNEGVAAADVNADGLCDIVMFSKGGNWIGFNQGETPPMLVGSNDNTLGLNGPADVGNGDFCSAGDMNNDGRLDFFYHYNGGRLFRSNNDGTFTEDDGGITVVTGNNDKFGSAWGDYDSDGDLDLFCPRYDKGEPGYLWRNDDGTFTNVAAAAGITDTSGQRSCCWGDCDNDGDLDLYIVTHSDNANLLYRNQGNGTFAAIPAGADAVGDGHDAVFVDYDNDGDLDLAVTRENETAILLRNTTDDNRYLKVRLIGGGEGATNRAAIGTRVELRTADGSTLLGRREVGVARGYGGTEPLRLHFGGVDPGASYILRVYFVGGEVDVPVVPVEATTTIGARTIGQMITIEENAAPHVVQWIEVEPGE